MKIIKTEEKQDSQWATGLVEASIPKYASLSVSNGKIMCPLKNMLVSTVNCEICQFCTGIDFITATNTEVIKCAHKNSHNIKQSKVDEVDRLFVSDSKEREKQRTDGVTAEDLKSIFARSTSKFDEIDEEDLMNGSKIVSAKNITENENDGTSSFIPKVSNSIFNSEIIKNMIEEQKQEDDTRDKKIAEAKVEKAKAKREWEDETHKSLSEIGYEPKGPIMSISHETEASNPDISEYKFSIFDNNLEDKVKNIPELTDGEKLKSQADQRRENISRTKIKDDWESNHSKNTTTSEIVKGFFDKMLGE